MDSLTAIFATSFVVALSGALVPGPMFTLTVAEAARGRWTAGPMVVAGHGVLELALLALVFAGLGGVISSHRSVTVLGLVGGIALIAMGIITLFGTGGSQADATGNPRAMGALRQAAAGAVSSVSNPYWVVWWATVGMGYLAMAGRFGPAGVGSFFGGHILADFAWFTLVSALVSSGRGVVGGKAYRAVVLACGVFLVVFGMYFVFRSVTS